MKPRLGTVNIEHYEVLAYIYSSQISPKTSVKNWGKEQEAKETIFLGASRHSTYPHPIHIQPIYITSPSTFLCIYIFPLNDVRRREDVFLTSISLFYFFFDFPFYMPVFRGIRHWLELTNIDFFQTVYKEVRIIYIMRALETYSTICTEKHFFLFIKLNLYLSVYALFSMNEVCKTEDALLTRYRLLQSFF